MALWFRALSMPDLAKDGGGGGAATLKKPVASGNFEEFDRKDDRARGESDDDTDTGDDDREGKTRSKSKGKADDAKKGKPDPKGKKPDPKKPDKSGKKAKPEDKSEKKSEKPPRLVREGEDGEDEETPESEDEADTKSKKNEPEAEELDEETLERAKAAQLSEKDIEELGPKGVKHFLSKFDRRMAEIGRKLFEREQSDEIDTDEADEKEDPPVEDKKPDPKPKVDKKKPKVAKEPEDLNIDPNDPFALEDFGDIEDLKLDPEEFPEVQPVVAKMNATLVKMRDHFTRQLHRLAKPMRDALEHSKKVHIANQRKEAMRINQEFDDWIATVPEALHEVIGNGPRSSLAADSSELKERARIMTEAGILERGWRHSGMEPPSRRSLWNSAARSLYSEKFESAAVDEVGKSLDERSEYISPRNTSKVGDKPSKDRTAAAREHVRDWRKARGLPVDSVGLHEDEEL